MEIRGAISSRRREVQIPICHLTMVPLSMIPVDDTCKRCELTSQPPKAELCRSVSRYDLAQP